MLETVRPGVFVALALAAFNLVVAVVGTLSPSLTGYGGTKEILIGLGLVLLSLPLYAIRKYGQRDAIPPPIVERAVIAPAQE